MYVRTRTRVGTARKRQEYLHVFFPTAARKSVSHFLGIPPESCSWGAAVSGLEFRLEFRLCSLFLV